MLVLKASNFRFSHYECLTCVILILFCIAQGKSGVCRELEMNQDALTAEKGEICENGSVSVAFA